MENNHSLSQSSHVFAMGYVHGKVFAKIIIITQDWFPSKYLFAIAAYIMPSMFQLPNSKSKFLSLLPYISLNLSENLVFHQENVSQLMIFYILITHLLDHALMLWEEVSTWSTIPCNKDNSCKCKCKCIRNWPLPIGAFQDQWKQIVINKHNLVKNPNWREADQLAIYKRRREVELRATENNIS